MKTILNNENVFDFLNGQYLVKYQDFLNLIDYVENNFVKIADPDEFEIRDPRDMTKLFEDVDPAIYSEMTGIVDENKAKFVRVADFKDIVDTVGSYLETAPGYVPYELNVFDINRLFVDVDQISGEGVRFIDLIDFFIYVDANFEHD